MFGVEKHCQGTLQLDHRLVGLHPKAAIMEAVEKAKALEQWYRDNGGYLHPSVSIAHSDEVGYHVRSISQTPCLINR